MPKFIFMLTHHDLTVPNAIDVFKEIRDNGVTHIGFKDVGLPMKKLRALVNLMRESGKTIFLEVVSETEKEALRSAKRSLELRVDYLIGGTYVEKIQGILQDRIRFMPYIGEVAGHPCELRGTIEEIVRDAERVEGLGVDGINLLAYRHHGDSEQLIASVKRAVSIPLIVAGSINSFDRIKRVTNLGVWGFTIGSAIFEKKFVPQGDLSDQITAVLKAIQ